jgi:hypothetical protein
VRFFPRQNNQRFTRKLSSDIIIFKIDSAKTKHVSVELSFCMLSMNSKTVSLGHYF